MMTRDNSGLSVQPSARGHLTLFVRGIEVPIGGPIEFLGREGRLEHVRVTLPAELLTFCFTGAPKLQREAAEMPG
jgi:hypothetical protein